VIFTFQWGGFVLKIFNDNNDINEIKRLKNDDNIERGIVFNMFNMYFLTPPRLGLYHG